MYMYIHSTVHTYMYGAARDNIYLYIISGATAHSVLVRAVNRYIFYSGITEGPLKSKFKNLKTPAPISSYEWLNVNWLVKKLYFKAICLITSSFNNNVLDFI